MLVTTNYTIVGFSNNTFYAYIRPKTFNPTLSRQ